MSISNILVPNGMTLYAGEITSPNFNISGTNDSTSTSTGALTVAGGVGIAKNIYCSGSLNGIYQLSNNLIVPTGSGNYNVFYTGANPTFLHCLYSSSYASGSGIWAIDVSNIPSPILSSVSLLASTGTHPNAPTVASGTGNSIIIKVATYVANTQTVGVIINYF